MGILRAFRDFSCKVRQVTIGSMIFVMASGASIWTPRAVPQKPRAAPQKPRAVTRGAAMGFQTLRARAGTLNPDLVFDLQSSILNR